MTFTDTDNGTGVIAVSPQNPARARGRARRFLPGGPGGPRWARPALGVILWVRRNGTRVDAGAYGGSSGGGMSGELFRLGWGRKR